MSEPNADMKLDELKLDEHFVKEVGDSWYCNMSEGRAVLGAAGQAGPGLCKFFAMTGNVEGIKWARSLGADWNADMMQAAAAGGHLNVIKFARQGPTPCPWSDCAYEYAVKSGNAELVKFLDDNECPKPMTKNCSEPKPKTKRQKSTTKRQKTTSKHPMPTTMLVKCSE
jgi:hypothetical protein